MNDQVFALPDLGEGLLEAELVRWHVKVGDPVAMDTPIAEVETAKAMVEIPSPYDGVVARLHAEEGAVVRVGEPLISVEAERNNVLVGYGPAANTGHCARRRSSTAKPAAPTTRAASPVVRKLAREHGIELTAVPATGPDGLVTRADVEHAVAALRPSTVDQRTGLPIGARIPLRGTRKVIAAAMTRSRQEIPEATIWVDVDATALVELRAALRAGGDDPGLLAMVARFVVAGLVRFPALNGTVNTDTGQIIQFDGVNLGIATQTERGLVVPAVAAAHTMTMRALGTEIRRLTTAARVGSASPTELTRGSFTLNNYGRFGIDGSASVINHPEVAILGIGRIMRRPWVDGDAIVPRHVGQLSLVFDHRVCDGDTAAGFLRFVADAIERPASALIDH